MRMKKLLPLGLAALTAPAYGLDIDVKHSGQFRLRHENYNIYEGRADKTDFSTMRLRAGFDFKLEGDRHIFIAPQAVKSFGELIPVSEEDGSTSYDQSSGDKNDSALEFHEAYALVPMGDVKLKMGRQELSYGDKVILGNRNWTPNGMTFDAVKASVSLFGGELDLVYSKIINSDPETVSDDDTLTFLYYKIIRDKQTELDAYTIFHNEASDGVNMDSVSTGFRYKKRFEKFGFVTENIYQDFKEQSRSGYNFNLELDYKAGKFTPFASYMIASKDYDQLYTNRHKYNGMIDIVGRRNLIRASLGAKYDLSSDWNLKAEVFQFNKASDDELAYNQATSKTLPGDIDESNLGQELDLVLNYSGVKNEVFSFGYSIFQHGDYFEEQDKSEFAYVQYLLKF